MSLLRLQAPAGCFGIIISAVLREKTLQNFSMGGLKKDNENLAGGTEVVPAQPWG